MSTMFLLVFLDVTKTPSFCVLTYKTKFNVDWSLYYRASGLICKWSLAKVFSGREVKRYAHNCIQVLVYATTCNASLVNMRNFQWNSGFSYERPEIFWRSLPVIRNRQFLKRSMKFYREIVDISLSYSIVKENVYWKIKAIVSEISSDDIISFLKYNKQLFKHVFHSPEI